DGAEEEQPRRRPELLDELGPVLVDDGRARESLTTLDAPEELLELAQRHVLDEDVDLAAAGQADRPGLLVRDPVGEELGLRACEHRLRLLVDLVLDTAAGNRPGELPLLRDRELRADRARRGGTRGDHGGQRHLLVAAPMPAP